MTNILLFAIATLLVLLLIKYSYVESFASLPETGPPRVPVGPPVVGMNFVTRPEFDLLTTPLVASVNSVIDTINVLPKKLVSGTLDMSHAISSKIREYGETLQSHARAPDNPESLSSVTVYTANKEFLDRTRTSNSALYSVLASQADAFYDVPFEDQDKALRDVLLKIVPLKNQIAPLLTTGAN